MKTIYQKPELEVFVLNAQEQIITNSARLNVDFDDNGDPTVWEDPE